MAAGLFGLSYGTALFALAMFKLLSFFIMPSLFFDMLFIGFPLGAWLGARFLAPERHFIKCLWALQAVMAGSVAACLMAKRFDYLRSHLFDIELTRLVIQVVTFVAMFLPFFAAYGLCEYLGYQVGRRNMGGRMRAVYALALFGAATAYVSLKTLLPMLGMARMLVLALGALALAILVLGERRARWFAACEIIALLAGSSWGNLDREFLSLYKGRGSQSTWDFRTNRGCRTVFQKWGRYSLCEILESPDSKVYYGFYNDMFQWEHAPRMGFSRTSLGAIPILLTRPGQRLAIIGSGGGRQVRLAQKLGDRSIVAIELESAVFDAVRHTKSLCAAFGRVYESSDVTPVRAEARGYFERSAESFDLIYMPSVGGYAQMMIEPGNMVRTFEAYRTLRDHLTPRGILAIWYPRGLDTKAILTDQYIRTLRTLGLKTEAYRNDMEFLILASRDPEARLPDTNQLAGLLGIDDSAHAASPEIEHLRPRIQTVIADPNFVPISDQKPFLAGNVRYILSMTQVAQLFGLAAGVLGLAGAWAWWGFRRRGDAHIPGRPFSAVAGLAMLVGANFLMMEHCLVLILFRRLYVYDDALGIGAVSFLTFSGLGSLVAARRLRPAFLAAGAIAMTAFLASAGRMPVAELVAIVPIALATGMFFPALFERRRAIPWPSSHSMPSVPAGGPCSPRSSPSSGASTGSSWYPVSSSSRPSRSTPGSTAIASHDFVSGPQPRQYDRLPDVNRSR